MSDRDYSKIGQTPFQSNVDPSLDVDELHMRETLGLNGRGRGASRPQPTAAPKQRHRFVQDGEVPVIHLSGTRETDATASLRGRIASLEADLEAERTARTKAEQSTQATLGQMHALETKMAHVEMSAREALAVERQARAQAEAERQDAIVARDAAEQALAAAAVSAAPKPRVKSTRATKPKGMPRTKEPQPIKWWLGKLPAKATLRS